MSQASERQTTINAIMRRPGFQQGLRDFHQGKAIPAGLPQESEWDYERGRLFAAATGAKLVHVRNGSVSMEQQIAFARLLKERTII